MSITWLIFLFLGSFSYLFIVWQRLRQDYASPTIFTVSFYVIAGIAAGSALAFVLGLARLWFWLMALGAGFACLAGWRRFKMRFFELFEALSLGLFYWLTMVYLGDAVINSSLASLIGFVVVGLIIFCFYFIEDQYKKFTWYKSGKLGFAGLVSLGTFFLIRAIIALFWPNVLFFSGSSDSIISSLLAFLLFLTLFSLSRQKA